MRRHRLKPEKSIVEVFERLAGSGIYKKRRFAMGRDFPVCLRGCTQGAGSGFIWDEEGHIVTNYHVIYQADSIEVTLSDEKVYKATVVGVFTRL